MKTRTTLVTTDENGVRTVTDISDGFDKPNRSNLNLVYLMKQRNFVQLELGVFERGFTRIYDLDSGLFIGHSINDKKTKIERENLDEWIKYFDRV